MRVPRRLRVALGLGATILSVLPAIAQVGHELAPQKPMTPEEMQRALRSAKPSEKNLKALPPEVSDRRDEGSTPQLPATRPGKPAENSPENGAERRN